MNPYIIAGAAAGAVLVIGGVAFILLRKKKGKKEEVKDREVEIFVPHTPALETDPLDDDEFQENLTEGFPTPDYDEEFTAELTALSDEFPQELSPAIAYLNSLNTGDVDSCQKLMEKKTFHFVLKAVKGVPVPVPTEAPAETPAETPAEAPAETPAETPAEAPAEAPAEKLEVEETLPYHALSILAQIHHRGLARNEQDKAEECAREFRSANALNILYKTNQNSKHVPSQQLTQILIAFIHAYQPLPREFHSIVPVLKSIILSYDKSSLEDSDTPEARQPERLVALALHALTLLLQHPENVRLILEDFIGRDPPPAEGEDQIGRPQSPRASRRGFSSTSPTPQEQPGDPSSPNTNYPTDSPQPVSRSERIARGQQEPAEVPDLPLSPLQDKIFEFFSHEDKNIAAWAIRFYSVQVLHMTLNEKRAFVSHTDFFQIALALLQLPLNEETLPVVQNIILTMYNICLQHYDKGKSFILKTGIAKQLFKILVRVDFKALGKKEPGHIEPLDDKAVYIPPSLKEPLTALSPPNELTFPDSEEGHTESRYVDRQVCVMSIIEHTLAIYKSLHHNIQCLEYLVKMGVATVISNILYNYNRKLVQTIELSEVSDKHYGLMLANTFELLRYLAALGVDQVNRGLPNDLRVSLESIGGIRVQQKLLESVPWNDFNEEQVLEDLSWTDRALLDFAFAYPALYALDEAPEDARLAFEFISRLRNSQSPVITGRKPGEPEPEPEPEEPPAEEPPAEKTGEGTGEEQPPVEKKKPVKKNPLYVKYFNVIFKYVTNAETFE